MKSEAVISEDGIYRYSLSREWEHRKPAINWVMLNPSTATAEKDDATIRRIINFSARWGFGGLIVTNLYAFRSTDPKKLWNVIDPVGPSNDWYIKHAAQYSARVVCAWGANATLNRAEDVKRILKLARCFSHKKDTAPGGVDLKPALYCLGKTKNGEPKHPVRLRADTELVVM